MFDFKLPPPVRPIDRSILPLPTLRAARAPKVVNIWGARWGIDQAHARVSQTPFVFPETTSHCSMSSEAGTARRSHLLALFHFGHARALPRPHVLKIRESTPSSVVSAVSVHTYMEIRRSHTRGPHNTAAQGRFTSATILASHLRPTDHRRGGVPALFFNIRPETSRTFVKYEINPTSMLRCRSPPPPRYLAKQRGFYADFGTNIPTVPK